LSFFDTMMKENQYDMRNEAYAVVGRAVRLHCSIKSKDFGNARDMRNFIDRIKEVQALRVSKDMKDLLTVTAEDICIAAKRAGLSGS